mmetsp:Transcript_52095/g.118750  ORF Transcript_52095/g.118750 Transcript_52095/m.118750 type:complete len:239 (-) Transcript_52095:342-1058(-)
MAGCAIYKETRRTTTAGVSRPPDPPPVARAPRPRGVWGGGSCFSGPLPNFTSATIRPQLRLVGPPASAGGAAPVLDPAARLGPALIPAALPAPPELALAHRRRRSSRGAGVPSTPPGSCCSGLLPCEALGERRVQGAGVVQHVLPPERRPRQRAFPRVGSRQDGRLPRAEGLHVRLQLSRPGIVLSFGGFQHFGLEFGDPRRVHGLCLAITFFLAHLCAHGEREDEGNLVEGLGGERG